MDLFNWDSILADFKAKAAEFKNAFDFLVNNPSKFANNAALNSQRNTLIQTGQVIRATIETTTSAIDKANQLLNSFKNMIGLSGLGVIPVVLPIAVVAGSVAAITYWLTQFYSLQKTMYNDLIQQGVPATQAVKQVSAPNVSNNPIFNPMASSGGFIETAKKIAPFAIVATLLAVMFR